MKHSKIESIEEKSLKGLSAIQVKAYGYGYKDNINFLLNKEDSKLTIESVFSENNHDILIDGIAKSSTIRYKQTSDSEVSLTIDSHTVSIHLKYEAIFIVVSKGDTLVDSHRIEWESLEPAGLS